MCRHELIICCYRWPPIPLPLLLQFLINQENIFSSANHSYIVIAFVMKIILIKFTAQISSNYSIPTWTLVSNKNRHWILLLFHSINSGEMLIIYTLNQLTLTSVAHCNLIHFKLWLYLQRKKRKKFDVFLQWTKKKPFDW